MKDKKKRGKAEKKFEETLLTKLIEVYDIQNSELRSAGLASNLQTYYLKFGMWLPLPVLAEIAQAKGFPADFWVTVGDFVAKHSGQYPSSRLGKRRTGKDGGKKRTDSK